jgi:hypothetical protein
LHQSKLLQIVSQSKKITPLPICFAGRCKADICNLFEDNQYDVIMQPRFEHIPDDTKTMQNCIAF